MIHIGVEWSVMTLAQWVSVWHVGDFCGHGGCGCGIFLLVAERFGLAAGGQFESVGFERMPLRIAPAPITTPPMNIARIPVVFVLSGCPKILTVSCQRFPR